MTARFLDFTPLREKRLTLAELTADLPPSDLRGLTSSMIDAMLAAIADCSGEHVTFVPHDLNAHDPYAADHAHNAALWTQDGHFAGLEGVRYVEKVQGQG